MTGAFVADLSSRSVLSITGADAAALLDRLVTTDTDGATDEAAAYAALLTPQGKVLADFLMVRIDGGFLLDVPKAAAADLVKRFTLYKLRAAVTVADVTADIAVRAVWSDGAPPAGPGRIVRDPRVDGLGWRAYGPRAAPPDLAATLADEAAWQAHRTRLAVPEAGIDFALGDPFPHDIALDQLHGVDFRKGCYVGQEVVSRMQHRSTARRRPVVVTADAPLPTTGGEITAAGRPVGGLGSVDGAAGLAIVRLDRVKDAMDAGAPVLVGDVPVRIALPAWAGYGWPAGGEAE
ncbi:YgfZ/GcvT domain-containing protein [Chthonobacter rhizosphaerae]|uniref:CAF17-like 4Fe-4S cluster assembly/insertion protein YgfZ n=1 Tax=Chthonobacter rhizosphaerae TaxID=2735553 RepID=UPI0015EFD88A|nr:folate-binding protein YgfZ [Chthonobacter rhizosphaerae]